MKPCFRCPALSEGKCLLGHPTKREMSAGLRLIVPGEDCERPKGDGEFVSLRGQLQSEPTELRFTFA